VQVISSPAALRRVARVYDYRVDFNPKAAAEVADRLIAAGDSLESFPYRGRSVPNSTMRELVTRYPYIIRYRIVRDTVRILRIRHTSRSPTKV
jgi:plasmid stabilization system protein ParE